MEWNAMVRLDWFGHCKRRDETENIIKAVGKNEDGEKASYRKTEADVERYCQKGPESMEHQGGMGH